MDTNNIINPYTVDEDITNNCNETFEYSGTNIWNNNFSAPEMTCDFAVLHRDLQEIKSLINDIKNCIKNFFSEQ